MMVEHVQILDHDHLFTRHQLTQGIDQNLAFFVVCTMEKTKNRDCVIYPIAQYNFLLHIYNLPFESCFMCCSPIKTICNFGVVTLEAMFQLLSSALQNREIPKAFYRSGMFTKMFNF